MTRYIGRHGTGRLAAAVLVGAIPPLMLKTEANPLGLPLKAFDDLRDALLADRSQFYRDLSAPFYGANRPGAKVSQGMRDAFWMWSMQVGVAGAYDCIRVFSETDHTEDLKRFDLPTLFIHGDDDQIVPIAAAARIASTMVPGAALLTYAGGAHGLTVTERDRFNNDVLAFIRSNAVPTARHRAA